MDATPPLTLHENPEDIFPTLKAAHIARFSAHGKSRELQRGQVLVEQGDQNVPFLLIISGEMEVVRPTAKGEVSTSAVKRLRSMSITRGNLRR
jgi:CRP-like cAMP-binding protein